MPEAHQVTMQVLVFQVIRQTTTCGHAGPDNDHCDVELTCLLHGVLHNLLSI